MSAVDKDDLRSELGQRRRALGSAEIESARAGVRAAVLDRVRAAGWSCVAGYVPLRTEPGSVELLDALREAGVRVLVPVVLDDRDLDWTEWGPPERLLGTVAVADSDLVLVPALAGAHDGTRLGRGGGSYDRALSRVTGEQPIAALIYAEEYLHELPRESWDIPVTAVVTPSGWTDLR
jgi:5-formyltetrahydrofolate cyclo-ligase